MLQVDLDLALGIAARITTASREGVLSLVGTGVTATGCVVLETVLVGAPS